MKIGIVGLGLIGGSMAKAYRTYFEEQNEKIEIYAYERKESTLSYAKLCGIVDEALDASNIGECDLVFVALYPVSTIEYIRNNAHLFKKGAFVIDLCGTKTQVCNACFPIAKEYGFIFVGGHPMAGTQYSGFKYSKANMFKGAPMVIVPPRHDDITLFAKIKELLAPAQFGKFSFTDAESHDRMIAFTSQLAHIVSNAYIKSPSATSHKGFSAGSYKDMTRVAWLNEEMWTELFFENREPLLYELGYIINSLNEYKEALADGDHDRMKQLLRDGRIAKENADGNGTSNGGSVK